MDALLGEPPKPPSPVEQPAREESPERPQALLYELAQQEVTRFLEAAGIGNPGNIGTLRRVVNGMVQAMATGDELLVRAMDEGETHLDLPRHMVNVAVFAIKIGQGAGCRDDELPWLGLAACLHDVGMSIISRRLLEKAEAYTTEESALLQRHPEKGFRILQTLGPEFEWLANVALQEHEREDGSGYPRGLKGDEIHEYAKIVGIADIYEALTHPRSYQKRMAAPDAVKELIISERRRFPDRILKGFIRGLSTFPVGSLVRLNTTELARIVSTNPAFPLRPVVEIVQGPKGEPLGEPRRVDLSANTLLYIADASPTKTKS